MSEPSVEEIVAETERLLDRGSYAHTAANLRRLIADWRKRGEALKKIRDAGQIEMALDPDWTSRVASAAITPQQPLAPSPAESQADP